MEIYAWEGISEDVLKATYTLYNNKTDVASPYYNDTLVLNMDFYSNDSSRPVNNQGWLRYKTDYWNRMLELYEEAFSETNKHNILNNKAPVCDMQFIEYFGVYEYIPYENNGLVHHHIGQDGQAVAIPSGMHFGGENSGIHKIESMIGVTSNAELHSQKVQEAFDDGYIKAGNDVWSTVDNVDGNGCINIKV